MIPPPGHTNTGAPPAVTRVSRRCTLRVSSTGLSVAPARSEPPAPAMNSTEHNAGSQFSPMRATAAAMAGGIAAGCGRNASSSTYQPECSPVVDTISSRRPGQAVFGSMRSMMSSGSCTSVPPHPAPGLATWKYRPGVLRRPRTRMPAGRKSRKRPAWCSVSTPVMWSSTTITSSAWPAHCGAKMPMVALPQPTRIRASSTPSITGGWPDCTRRLAPPSTVSSTAPRLASVSIAVQVATPSRLLPPVRWRTPPRLSIWLPYSAVVTCPTCSPPTRTGAHSGPIWRSVSIFTFRPQ